MEKPIQARFGQQVIDAFTQFAREDLKTPAEYANDEFAHVADPGLRRNMSEVFYGVRWIYKVGLALLTKDVERAAHVRAQIVDYASIAEGLLSYCIGHAIRGGHVVGTSYEWRDPDRQNNRIKWNLTNPEAALQKQSFWWLIRIAGDFKIIQPALQKELGRLRVQRNSVHVRHRATVGKTAYLNQSKRAFDTVVKVIQQTKRWRQQHA